MRRTIIVPAAGRRVSSTPPPPAIAASQNNPRGRGHALAPLEAPHNRLGGQRPPGAAPGV